MFDVKNYEDKYKIYELIDSEKKSYIKICPERGGIIIGFGVNETETLYLDKKTFYDSSSNIRGGIPVLFPLCGQLPNGKYELNGTQYSMKNHGLARINKWEVIDTSVKDNASITIKFQSDELTKKSFPFDFQVIFKYTLKGNELTISQQFENKSNIDMPMSIGYHPYFKAESKDDIFYDTNATEFLDNNDMKIKPVSKENINISKSVESKILLNHTGKSFTFKLNDLNRTFTFTYDKLFKYIVLWSVIDSDFVCVEPWSAKNSSLSTKQDLIYVKPNDKLDFSISLKIEL
ncbi:aldose epimerase [Clostridium akagii]|uniref:aldose epimerase family protein n=1 Tax=Clostridium akagii TaxID=91623 RepID=UPI00047AA805|nr:aldose epimerase [Clostridium akagii]